MVQVTDYDESDLGHDDDAHVHMLNVVQSINGPAPWLSEYLQHEM